MYRVTKWHDFAPLDVHFTRSGRARSALPSPQPALSSKVPLSRRQTDASLLASVPAACQVFVRLLYFDWSRASSASETCDTAIGPLGTVGHRQPAITNSLPLRPPQRIDSRRRLYRCLASDHYRSSPATRCFTLARPMYHFSTFCALL